MLRVGAGAQSADWRTSCWSLRFPVMVEVGDLSYVDVWQVFLLQVGRSVGDSPRWLEGARVARLGFAGLCVPADCGCFLSARVLGWMWTCVGRSQAHNY